MNNLRLLARLLPVALLSGGVRSYGVSRYLVGISV